MPLKALTETLGLLFRHELCLDTGVFLRNILEEGLPVADIDRATRDTFARQETSWVFWHLEIVFFLQSLG